MIKYTTLDNLKEHIWRDNINEEFSKEIIDKITTLFDSYLWYNLWEKTYWEYIDNIEDEYCIFPQYSPII